MEYRQRTQKQRRKPLLIIVIVLVAGWFLWHGLHNDSTSGDSHTANSSSNGANTPATHKADTIRLIAMGDMLPHDTVNQAARTASGYDYTPLFSKVSPYIKDADMVYCNQESPTASQFSVSGYPTFNAPVSFAKNLSTIGCNIINLANNHANDRGQAGVAGTRSVWDRLPSLAVAGISRSQSEQNDIALFTKGGIKFAFLSYVKCSNSKLPNSYGVNILSRPLVDRQITAARSAGAQMIIVGTHWCHENTSHQDADQDQWASYLASKGVDIVIGTGPHWLQPVKQLPKAGGGKTLVWFSLGNFLSSQIEINGLIGGIAVMDIDSNTHAVTHIGFLPTYMHYEWTAAQAARQDLLARHNLMIYPLDQAAAALARSQNHTAVAEQTQRVTTLLNTYTHVDMLTSKSYSSFGE